MLNEGTGDGEQFKNVHEKLARIKQDLCIEQILYQNMKEILKKRGEEIDRLYEIISALLKDKQS